LNAIIHVPSGGAWFEGHFPGRPILPGVAELVLAADALAQTGSPLALRGIAFARLRQLVFPGDRLELVTRQRQGEHLRFDLKRADILVASAEFTLGTPQAAHSNTRGATTSIPRPAVFPALDELLPHRAPMRFVTDILQATTDSVTCVARIPSHCALVAGGGATPIAAIEAAAQAAAAWEALRRRQNTAIGAPRIGYLVALRDVVFFAGRVPADRDLLVSASLEAAAPPLTHYRFAVCLDGDPVTRGTIATYLAA
jgi:3-hydroxyacyl-[acyl-carrier-protein] dehydratase